MLVAVWVMTIPIGPFLALIYKSFKSSKQYKHRSIPSLGLETELQIPDQVFAVKLVELTDHRAAVLIVHDACKTNRADGNDEVQSDITSNAFESYAKQEENVSVQALTAVSACATNPLCTDMLGALGEAMMSSGFIENASLLIMQQGAFVDELEKEEKMGYVGETHWAYNLATSRERYRRLFASNPSMALDNQTLAVMLVAVWVMTIPTGPFLSS
ncbi:hypothetical protein M0R45_036824 [Rubus argutus]|uniref:Uncharacterized protein n=1 Tax=Rubus argutus TaxID=59490 RepID=A0AAW1W1T0_RUBAR